MPVINGSIAGLALIVLVAGVAGSQVSGRALRGTLGGSVGAELASFAMYDALENEGKGRSDATTSGGLGWGESSFLRNYMLCYHATRDPYWLDKVIDHFDRMRANMTDLDGDGFLAWSDPGYSVGLAEIAPEGNVGAMEAELAATRIYVGRGGELVTGHQYRLEPVDGGELAVRDVTVGQDLETLPYADPMAIESVPGLKVTVKGPPEPGAAFVVSTVAPQPCEYQVHDGMVTYPVAQFIEAACARADLPETYRDRAREYASVLQRHFFEKWEPTWLDLGDGTGVYKFSANPTQRFPDISAPHNQFLALARTWLVLQSDSVASMVEEPQRALYRDRAEKMGRYFKQALRENGDAYVWNYWDPLPSEEGISRHIEDIGHATIDIGFAVEASRRGLVFAEGDLRRFAQTYSRVMWNGSAEDPRFGGTVDTNQGDTRGWSEWIQLGIVSEDVCTLAAAIYEAAGRTPTMAPQVVNLYDAVVGLTDEDRRHYEEGMAAVREAVEEGGLINGGFEQGLPGAKTPLGWTLTEWTPGEGGTAEWMDGGRDGGKAITLTGGGDVVNLVAQPTRKLRGAGGRQVTIRAHYTAEEGSAPDFSLLAFDAAGERVQYETSPRLEPSDDWTAAEWTVTLADGAETFTILLRNHARGAVGYDDVSVTVG